jgi:hypothetical protein
MNLEESGMNDGRALVRRSATLAGFCLASAAPLAAAQSIPGAVLAKREPHHHLVYEDAAIRVLRVRVPPHDTTLLHEHDPDYFWVSLGPSTLINVRPGSPDATVRSPDLAFHYSFGKFAHIARNPGDGPFDNITVELLESQANVRNLCEAVLADKPLDCPSAPSGYLAGATEHPAFATSQLRVSLETIKPRGTLRPSGPVHAAWIIALDSSDTKHALVVTGGPKWAGGTFRVSPGQSWGVANVGNKDVRVIAIVKP